MGRVFSGAVSAFLSPLAAAQNQVNMSPGVTEIGADIFELHMLIMWICVVIGVAVFAVMFYSIYAHRKSKGHQASQFHESTKVEVAWTVVPFLILIAMAVPATSTLLEVYDSACLACHGAQGQGGIGNAIAGSAVVMGDLSNHIAVVARDVSGTAMQAFGGQLNDVEMAAGLTYQRNAFGNNTGDVVQPGDVNGMKNG